MKTEEEILEELKREELKLKTEPFYGTPDVYAKIKTLKWVLEE